MPYLDINHARRSDVTNGDYAFFSKSMYDSEAFLWNAEHLFSFDLLKLHDPFPHYVPCTFHCCWWISFHCKEISGKRTLSEQ